MKTRVIKFNKNAPKAFAGALLGMAPEAINGIGQGMEGMGQGLEAFGSVNDETSQLNQQQLLQSQQGGALSEMLKRKQKSEAGYNIAKSSAGSVPVVGKLLTGGMDLVKGAASLIGGPEDEFGVRKGQYKRNDDLRNSRDTFFKDKENSIINANAITGAQASFNTPKFQTPAFGKFGMKFKRFR